MLRILPAHTYVLARFSELFRLVRKPVADGEFVRAPLAYVATSFAAGICAEQLCDFGLAQAIALALASSTVAAVAALKASLRIASVALLVAGAALAFSLAYAERNQASPHNLKSLLQANVISSGEPVELSGTVVRAPEYAPDRVIVELGVESIRAQKFSGETQGVVAVSFPLKLSKEGSDELAPIELRYGARLRIMTALRRSDRFRNPGVSPFTEFLDRRGYDATAFVKSPLLVERLDDESVLLPLALLFEWRRKLEGRINEIFSAETAAVLNAALLGNHRGLSRTTAERFRDGGTFHVLVISGMHISFIGGVVLLVVRRVTRNRWIQFAAAAALLWSYTIAVGAGTSVLRAAVMFTFIAFGPVVARRASSINSLGAAALLLLAVRPSSLFDPSFQLTFLSVVAIVLFAWPIVTGLSVTGTWTPTRETPRPAIVHPWLRSLGETMFWDERSWQRDLAQSNFSYRLFKSPGARWLNLFHLQRLVRWTFVAAIVSFCVQLMLLPLSVFYFHRVSIAGLLLNIGVSLLMATVSLVAGGALIVSMVSPTLATPLISLTEIINWLMIHSVDPFSALRVASYRLPEYSGWAASIYLIYFVPLLVILGALNRWNSRLSLAKTTLSVSPTRRRWLLTIVGVHAVLVCLLLSHPASGPRAGGVMRIDFLDVDQGDSALLTFPDDTTLLIDGGGAPRFNRRDNNDFEPDTRSVGEAVVSEFLWYRGLDTIDYILATHADADHIDGLGDVVRNFHVRTAFLARMPAGDPEFAKFKQAADETGVPLTLVAAGDTLQFGDASATVLWPLPGASAARSTNNDSLVLRLDYREHSVLLTGDLEREGERSLLRLSDVSKNDVVKVAHHGSKSSSTREFVAASRPELAIISVGRESIFGHPHREVIDRWQAAGARVLTTGECGTITVILRETTIDVETFVRCGTER